MRISRWNENWQIGSSKYSNKICLSKILSTSNHIIPMWDLIRTGLNAYGRVHYRRREINIQMCYWKYFNLNLHAIGDWHSVRVSSLCYAKSHSCFVLPFLLGRRKWQGNASHGDQSAFSKRRDPFGRVSNRTAFSMSPAIENIALRSPFWLSFTTWFLGTTLIPVWNL
jgi:hypothetical protein